MSQIETLKLIDNIYDGIALSFGAPGGRSGKPETSEDSLNLSLEALENVARNELRVNGEQPLDEVLPHLRRAIEIRSLLRSFATESMWLTNLLDIRSEAVFLINADQKIFFSNDAAERLVSERTSIQLYNGRLQPVDRACATKFAQLVAEIAASMRQKQSATHFIFTQKDAPPLPAIVIRLAPREQVANQQTMAVLVRNPKTGPSAELIRQFFDLSATESALAVELAMGRSTDEAAERMGVMPSTIRTHLKSIFAKTDTRRQSELVAKLARLPSL